MLECLSLLLLETFFFSYTLRIRTGAFCLVTCSHQNWKDNKTCFISLRGWMVTARQLPAKAPGARETGWLSPWTHSFQREGGPELGDSESWNSETPGFIWPLEWHLHFERLGGDPGLFPSCLKRKGCLCLLAVGGSSFTALCKQRSTFSPICLPGRSCHQVFSSHPPQSGCGHWHWRSFGWRAGCENQLRTFSHDPGASCFCNILYI